MKILFLSRWFPYPSNNGSKIRIFNLLKGLSRCHEVTLLSFIDPGDTPPDEPLLQEICSECHTVPWREFDPNSRRARFGFLSPKPRFILDTHSAQMENEINRLVSKNKYDLVIASQLSMAAYHDAFGNVKAIFEELEIGGFYEQAHSAGSFLRRLRNRLTWLKLHSYLSGVLKSFSVCTVASEKEKKLFVEMFPGHQSKAMVIPNGIDLTQYRASNVERGQHRLVFSGSFRYAANYQAAVWFLEKVYPLILESVPDIQLFITGDHANLPLPMTTNVHLTGHVDDIKSLIASCDVSIVPIWSGGGTRLKILEAMALGTPVVSTSKGAEGLLSVNGKHILVVDDPEGFATGVIRLLQVRKFAGQMASDAFQLVKDRYDWAQIMPGFLQMIENVTAGTS
jgi:glycosyltransferase involved in cell wall biosynthesis